MYRKRWLLCALLIFSVSLSAAALSAQEVNLPEKAQSAGMMLYWDPLSLSGVLEKNGHQISFQSGSSFIMKDYQTIVSEKAPYVKDGSLIASVSFFNEAQKFFQEGMQADDAPAPSDASPAAPSSYGIGAIVIDPGHGGKDPGAISPVPLTVNGKKVSVMEKDITLKIGLMLYDALRVAYPGKKIIMTRKDDTFVSLQQRTEIANGVKLKDDEAILYLSIHVNSSFDKSASGYEVWYLSPDYRRQVTNTDDLEDKTLGNIINSLVEEEYTTESILLANFIQNGINTQVGKLSKARGLKAENFAVVRNAMMPSILIETGFISNEKEAGLLTDDSYLKKMSLGIYNGLQAFISHFERTRGFTSTR